MSEYNSALNWLFGQLPMFSRVGAAAYKPGLDRSIALANHFGNPQNNFKSIHIGGTNGKGSTSHLIASVLQQNGYKTALYTSPHLVDFRERIRINGKMIPKEDVVKFVDTWRENANEYSDRPSFFELTMMMAFDWFSKENVDFAVIEVGMGGRLDSTNIITPILSVITNISWDHSQFLGDSLSKIASEKAGIIKPEIPVVIGEAEGDIEKIFRAKAHEVGAPIIEAYRDISNQLNQNLYNITPLHGDYQKYNINTARVAIEHLQKQNISLTENDIYEGFRYVLTNTGLQGRWQILAQHPLTICDTGHNEAGIRYNMRQLERLTKERPGGKLHIVAGFVADKDIDHILPLFPQEAFFYLTQASIPRALAVDKLMEKAKTLNFDAQGFPTVTEAFAAARENASDNDIIFVGGSTFIVADLLKEF